jgi:hypothetical protein
MLMQVDITERAKVEATLAKLTESQVSGRSLRGSFALCP